MGERPKARVEAVMGRRVRAASPAIEAPAREDGAVTTLMEEALRKLAAAREHMATSNALQGNHHLQWAMGIIGALQDAVTREAGEAAARLDALYEYMHGQLFRADRYNDAALLDEVAKLMVTIRCDDQWIELHRPAADACAS